MSGRKSRASARPGERVAEGVRRSPVYQWLRRHYRIVEKDSKAGAVGWRAIAGRIAGEGVVGVRGSIPNGESVRRVWQRVKRDVAIAKAGRVRNASEERLRAVGRASDTWRPRPVYAGRVTRGVAVAVQDGGRAEVREGAGRRQQTAAEKLADLRRVMDERSVR